MKRDLEMFLILLIAIVLLFLAPIGVVPYLYSGTGEIYQMLVAPLWTLDLYGPFAGVFQFRVTFLNHYSPELFSQLLLVVMVSIYYQGRVDRKYVILSGLSTPILVMIRAFTSIEPFAWWMTVPIPIMLIYVLLIVLVVPSKYN